MFHFSVNVSDREHSEVDVHIPIDNESDRTRYHSTSTFLACDLFCPSSQTACQPMCTLSSNFERERVYYEDRY